MKAIKLISIFIICSIACQDLQTESKLLQDHWFRRSSLDQRPGILTIQLHDDIYVAFDTRTSALYKVWQGGVNWVGANFNDIKSIQPSTWGLKVLDEDPDEPHWFIKDETGKRPAIVTYKSFLADKVNAQLNYEIQNEDIIINEQLSFISRNDSLIFKREFQLSGDDSKEVFYNNFNVTTKGFYDIVIPNSQQPRINKSKLNNDPVGQYWLDREGCNTCHEEIQTTTGPSYAEIAQAYPKTDENIDLLANKIISGGSGAWGTVSMAAHPQISVDDAKRMVNYILSVAESDELTSKTKKPKALPVQKKEVKPGFGTALDITHPSFDLISIRPDWFKPRVGGLDFTDDGRLLVSTWDSIGAVYAISGLAANNFSEINIQQIASGLSEPLGIKEVDGDIYVLQKHELTKLIDHDGDSITDEYVNICNSFEATYDFHEYSYGLEFKDGWFYATLGVAMRLMSHERQLDDRGTAIRISLNGDYEIVADGLRQPNGIGKMETGDIFITENQGQYVPASKLIHLKHGEYHGCEYGTGDKYSGGEAVLPVVWMPHHEIGNSPSQPIEMIHGPYKGQLLYGDVTHGGIKRVALDIVNSNYQGALFRFSQGLEAGVNRLAWGPDDALYVGGVGMTSNWSWKGKQYGLEKLVYNENVPFEMLSIKLVENGFEIEFTQKPDQQNILNIENYHIEQWRYEITPKYGGDKLDYEVLNVENVLSLEDSNKLIIEISDLKENRVIHIRLSDQIKSRTGQLLFTGDAWYTLNSFHKKDVI